MWVDAPCLHAKPSLRPIWNVANARVCIPPVTMLAIQVMQGFGCHCSTVPSWSFTVKVM